MPNSITVNNFDFREILEDIEDTQASDFIGSFTATSGTFLLDNGMTVQFSQAIHGPGTFFSIDDGSPGSLSWSFWEANIDFDNGFDIQSALNTRQPYDIPDAIFINTTYLTWLDSVTIGFDQPENFQTFGTMYGRGGNDEFYMGIDNIPLDLRPENEPRVTAFGNTGDDTFYIDAPTATAVGGWGDDTFQVFAGTVGLRGGAGADTLIFDNAAPLSRYVSPVERSFAIIRDFEAEDTLVFADTEGEFFPDLFSQGPATSFADLFNTTDLSTLSAQTVGGVTFFFGHAADGDARIFRRGEDADGNTYHENIRFDGLTLADLDATQIFISTFGSADL